MQKNCQQLRQRRGNVLNEGFTWFCPSENCHTVQAQVSIMEVGPELRLPNSTPHLLHWQPYTSLGLTVGLWQKLKENWGVGGSQLFSSSVLDGSQMPSCPLAAYFDSQAVSATRRKWQKWEAHIFTVVTVIMVEHRRTEGGRKGFWRMLQHRWAQSTWLC